MGAHSPTLRRCFSRLKKLGTHSPSFASPRSSPRPVLARSAFDIGHGASSEQYRGNKAKRESQERSTSLWSAGALRYYSYLSGVCDIYMHFIFYVRITVALSSV